MSLSLRLTLVTLSVVSVMGIASLVSLRLNHRIRNDVEGLDRTSDVKIDPQAILGQALSIEGRWEAGSFVASNVVRLPATRRPKLRGSLEAIDLAAEALTLYGRTLRVTGDTEYEQTPEDGNALAALQPGQRVEISCRIEADGGWSARKIETRGVKKSDKIKGTITRAECDSAGDCQLEIQGLPISVGRGVRIETPRGALYRMESATQMTIAIQECLSAAHELLKERYRERELRARGGAEQAVERKALIEDVEDRLLDGYEVFSQYLAESRAAEEADRSDPATRDPGKTDKLALWIAPIEDRRATFQQKVEKFLELTRTDLDAAQALLDEQLGPYLRAELLPRVHAYHLETEEAFSDETEAIARRASAAAQLELVTDAAGLVLALTLGLIVSRSISRPILALKAAAQEIGHGKLETRVAVRSKDEIGVLAASFNRMAEELAGTTVKVTDLELVEEELRRSLAEKEVLLREVHHRVKNNLQVISSLLSLESRAVTDPLALSRFQETQDLVQAIVFVHDQLLRSRDVEHIDLRAYLELLTSSLVRSHAIGPERVRISVEVDELKLDMDRAQVCGLIVNELVTNAFKHAFPGGRSGEVRVSCRRTQSGDIALAVADDGPGFQHDFAGNGTATVGLSLVRTLAHQLHGRLHFDGSRGASYRIEFPETSVPEPV